MRGLPSRGLGCHEKLRLRRRAEACAARVRGLWLCGRGPSAEAHFLEARVFRSAEALLPRINAGAATGHERGAFTGAAERRIGCFELADGGSLLLDEIGEMPAPTQAKLLSVLEDHKVRRLGSHPRCRANILR